jgi:hypothetical protein
MAAVEAVAALQAIIVAAMNEMAAIKKKYLNMICVSSDLIYANACQLDWEGKHFSESVFILAPLQGAQSFSQSDPVVYAALRPLATFC